MPAERLLRGTVKSPFRALAVFATTTILVGGSAFAQVPHSVFAPSPFVDRGAEKSRIAEEKGRKKWLSCKKQASAGEMSAKGQEQQVAASVKNRLKQKLAYRPNIQKPTNSRNFFTVSSASFASSVVRTVISPVFLCKTLW